MEYLKYPADHGSVKDKKTFSRQYREIEEQLDRSNTLTRLVWDYRCTTRGSAGRFAALTVGRPCAGYRKPHWLTELLSLLSRGARCPSLPPPPPPPPRWRRRRRTEVRYPSGSSRVKCPRIPSSTFPRNVVAHDTIGRASLGLTRTSLLLLLSSSMLARRHPS